ncbi:MAG: hypothetical protein WD607_10945 [Candidatus Paceibacterota bacterium]
MKERISKIPLFGMLIYCTFDDHKHTVQGILTMLFFALLPIIIMLVYDRFDLAENFTFSESLFHQIKNGEFYIYATSFLSPVLWIILRERVNESKSFPHKLSHVIVFFSIWVICLIAFFYIRTTESISSATIESSYIIFFITVVLIYLVTIYDKSELDPAKKIRDSESNFTDKLKKHRGS